MVGGVMAHVMQGAESAVRQPVKPANLADSKVDACIERATVALLAAQRRDGHWVFELEADATIPAEYVLLKHYLGEPVAILEKNIANYLRSIQLWHGGCPLCHAGPFNIKVELSGEYVFS